MSGLEGRRVVIVGAGFAGLAAAKALAKTPAEITLIDKRNHHLFQPLLYQVATAGLSPADVAWPIRGIFAGQPNVNVVLGDVMAVDRERQVVETGDRSYPYDHLVIASGARHGYFGQDQIEPWAPGLKRIIDATEIRKRVLIAFERAEIAATDDDRRRQLTFLIVGGGPTGVEMAGAIAELARHALARDFRMIDPGSARIVLAEAGQRLLAAFPEELSAYAKTALERLGVEVRLGERVAVEGPDMARIGPEELSCATMIWAAGVSVPRVGRWLGVETDRAGRVAVTEDLTLPGDPRVFVVGDAAAMPWQEGRPAPGIAPAAKQAGRHAGRAIAARLGAGTAPGPFRYRHMGNLATIGRNAAVADFGRVRFRGAFAWWLWGIAHIYFLIGVRAPLLVATQWFWSYLTYGRGARLITGVMPLFEPARAAESEGRRAM